MVASSLYDVLGVARTATDKEIRRAYRTLATTLHPDKLTTVDSGAVHKWQEVQHAYEVLSDLRKRKLYDTTGTWQRGADEEFMDAFAGGAFRDRGKGAKAPDPTPLDQLIVVKPNGSDKPSHTAGFEAWLRSRGMERGAIFTADDAAAAYGVTRTSYEPVPIPAAGEPVPLVRCMGPGKPRDVLALDAEPLPAALEWGQLLVSWLYAPVNPADLYSARLGGIYAAETTSTPYVAGHDGVGMIAQVGPGVKDAKVGDLVLPARSFTGTWRSAAVVRETDVLCLPTSIRTLLQAMHAAEADDDTTGNYTDDGHSPAGSLSVPRGVEVLALAREALVAYLLLERHGSLKPGDCVLINAPTSSVGQSLLQLAKLLKLRAVAVARRPRTGPVAADASTRNQRDQSALEDEAAWSRLETWLMSLGATIVIPDEGSVRVELDRFKFFAKPKVALDAVGGPSAVRLADAVVDGGEVVSYGCLSGQNPVWPWQQWVFRDLRVTGFNLRRWLQTGGGYAPTTASLGASVSAANNSQSVQRLTPVLESLLKLVAADLLHFRYTQYELTEFPEALEHAEAAGRNTKVLMKLQPSGA